MKLMIICIALLASVCLTIVSWLRGPVVWHRPTPMRTIFTYTEELDDGRDIPSPREVPGTKPSKFLYLVQTESCLPSNLRLNETIGNPKICNCDVLVLSYRKECRERPSDHFKYIFDSNTTWAKGRNLLFEVAMKRKEKYWYYIFMDDDIILKSLEDDHQPWRTYENFLRQVEPAVGGVDCTCYPFLKYAYRARRRQGCGPIPSLYYSTPRFDAALNSFHYQAIEYILPYSERFDDYSWSLAALYASIKMELFFAGHSILHTQLYVTNPKHRPYPRKEFTHAQLISILDTIECELPMKYRNSTVLAEWRKSKYTHEHNSKTFCMPPAPPHTPVRPFVYATQVKLAEDSINHYNTMI